MGERSDTDDQSIDVLVMVSLRSTHPADAELRRQAGFSQLIIQGVPN
jgi:hypothetical protein